MSKYHHKQQTEHDITARAAHSAQSEKDFWMHAAHNAIRCGNRKAAEAAALKTGHSLESIANVYGCHAALNLIIPKAIITNRVSGTI